MATNTFVEIDIPEAVDLADLTGVRNDFDKSKRFAIYLKGMFERNPADFSLAEPMTIAILIIYNRPFTKGVRHWNREEDIKNLSTEHREAHNRFRFWRDKHITHSVNPFEDNQPIARYWVERFDDEGFTSVSCNSSELIGMSLCDVEMIIDLSNYFISRLQHRIEIEENRVLEAIRLLPKQQVLSMKKSAKLPNMDDIGKARKRRHNRPE